MHSDQGMMEQMETYAVRARAIAPHCDNEEQTKVSLINPYLELLGYDVRDPRHVRLEVRADIHQGQEKVDYAVMREGQPWLVVEAKAATNPLAGGNPTKQIVRYAMAIATVEYAVFTNGKVWRWFRKANGSQMLEDTPFLEHDVCEPEQREIRWLAGIHQARWSGEEIARIADEESMRSQFDDWFERAKDTPPDWLLGRLLNDIGRRATAPMVERARTAWTATVRGRESAILARASRRLQAEEPATEPIAAPETAEERPKARKSGRRRWHYRVRSTPEAAWEYHWNSRAAAIATAAIAVRTLGADGIEKLWETKTITAEQAESEGAQSYYETIPGTDRQVYTNLDGESQRIRIKRLVEAVAGLEVETDGGERDDNQSREERTWRPV